jgi:hypothetical protein
VFHVHVIPPCSPYRQNVSINATVPPQEKEKKKKMDQLDPALVQRVNAKVSTVVERYLLDDQDVTPKNTYKVYGPKQAEWMVSSHLVVTNAFPLLS